MKLKELRKNKNLSQGEIGKLLNVAQTTYAGYELGKAEPTIDTLCKLADIYDVSLDYLVGRDYHNEIGFLNKEQKTAVELIKELTPVNILQAIAYMSGLITNQK